MSEISHVLWLRAALEKALKSAPRRQWRWAAYSSGWDADYIREVFRRDATEDSDAIWQATSEWLTSNRWPKLSARSAHFLRERLREALVLCEAWLAKHPLDAGQTATRPPGAESLLRQLVIDHWNQTGHKNWLDEHQAEFQEDPPD